MLRWLKTGKLQLRPPSSPGLPDPIEILQETDSLRDAGLTMAANEYAETEIENVKKRKRGHYSNYDENTRAKIARYAVDNGVSSASRKFTNDLGFKVSKTTVRSMRDAYIKLKKSRKDDLNITTLPKSPRGNPLMLGELDNEVQKWIKRVRLSGGVINSRIVMAGADAMVTKLAKHKLEKYGGHIVITKTLAISILRRMGYVKRKGTKTVKALPADFNDIKQKLNEKVHKVVDEHKVPDDLIINWDQTGCQMVPGGDWTMEQVGSNQVTICGLDDKRQVTLLLSIAKSGALLPAQLIYQGKTDRCLPKVSFPTDWNVTFSETHWSNEDTMLQYVDQILLPYVESVRESLPITMADQKAVAIFDVYKAHRGTRMLDKLKENGIIPLYVPACRTDRLQPLDIAVNHEYKEILKSRFHDWYSHEVISQLNDIEDKSATDDVIDVSRVNVDLRTSVLKPIHAKWVMSTHETMSNKTALIVSAFEKAGL